MQVSLKVNKSLFLDRKAVEDIVGKNAAKGLTKAGSYIRQRARASMKVGKRLRAEADFYRHQQASPPGKPPRSWSEHPVASLRNVQYQFDPSRMSIVVGPKALNGRSGFAVPGVHEHGEAHGIPEWRYSPSGLARSWMNWRNFRSSVTFKNEWRRGSPPRSLVRNSLSRVATETRTRKASYPQRPYMGPALQKVIPKLPSILIGRSV